MQSYYQIYPAIINNTSGSASAENIASKESLEYDMELTLYFASTFHSAMDIIFPKLPSKPPDGFITAFIMIPITCIFISSQFIISCVHIMSHKPNTTRKRRHKILAEAAACRNQRSNRGERSCNFSGSILVSSKL